jgi:hypothetical protein
LAAYHDRYRVEVWEVDGNLRRVLERSIPEFRETRDLDCLAASWVPRPYLADIQMERAGRLIVMLSLGDRKWRDGSEEMGVVEGRCPALRVTDRDLFRDTWIEIWDLSKGEVTIRTAYVSSARTSFTPRSAKTSVTQ